MPTLTEAFLAAAPTENESDAEVPRDLEALLEKIAEKGETAWPGLRLDRAAFAAQLARCAGAWAADLAERLDALHASDLYLACACAHGDPAAQRTFDAHFLPGVDRYVAAVDASPQFAADVRQNLREELLLPREGGTPKIADYSGRGPLGGWLRVVAVRRALNLRRDGRVGPTESEDLAIDVPSDAPDPELDYLKALYRREFREAFVAALARLGTEERNVLRLHHLDGLTLDEVAVVCRVSRATVARWLAEARRQILGDTLRLLRERLRLDDVAMKSVLRLVQSQLDISIHRYLDAEREDRG